MRRAEVPVGATGLLARFAEAGMLRPVDFHMAQTVSSLSGTDDELVQLAMALAARELRLGSACLDLETAHLLLPETQEDDGLLTDEDQTPLPWPETDSWLRAVRDSPAISPRTGPARAFRLSGPLLYMERFWQEERIVEEALHTRSKLPFMPVPPASLQAALGLKIPLTDPSDGQYRAVEMSLTAATTVITGGPGTGKTTTVARILAGLANPIHPPLVGLVAPTGKAATRLETAVREDLKDTSGLRLRSSTLHKLLAVAPGREKRTYTPDNPLPHDVVIVDETSMVSLTMMSMLLQAVGTHTRLVLIGDPNQLESVEVGAVLADIASSPDLVRTPDGQSAVVGMTTNFRSIKAISNLADAIRRGNSDEALSLLGDDGPCTITEYTGIESLETYEALRRNVESCALGVTSLARSGDGPGANTALDTHRILCAHREGPFGVSHWSGHARAWLSGRIDGYAAGRFWAGQPLLVTRSSDIVSNGDTGVVVLREGRLLACIDRAGGPLWRDPSSLHDVADLHAMTIHKSQGSQFDAVSIILPPVGSPLLTRQLLYTAITRARNQVSLYGSREAFAMAIATPARRASGLGLQAD